jgi:hypothetical protein
MGELFYQVWKLTHNSTILPEVFSEGFAQGDF